MDMPFSLLSRFDVIPVLRTVTTHLAIVQQNDTVFLLCVSCACFCCSCLYFGLDLDYKLFFCLDFGVANAIELCHSDRGRSLCWSSSSCAHSHSLSGSCCWQAYTTRGERMCCCSLWVSVLFSFPVVRSSSGKLNRREDGTSTCVSFLFECQLSVFFPYRAVFSAVMLMLFSLERRETSSSQSSWCCCISWVLHVP